MSGSKRSLSKIANGNKQITRKTLLEWGIEVVVMSILPSIVYSFFLLFTKDEINLFLVLENGDLLMAATIVSLTSLLHAFWKKKETISTKIHLAYYLAIICVISGLLVYPYVKMGTVQNEKLVAISIIQILCAYTASYVIERH